MKKFWSILLASMMILSMTACGGSETPASSSSSEAAPASSSEAASSEAASASSEAASSEASAETADVPTMPDVSNVDMAALDAQIDELAAKVTLANEGKLVMGTSADFAPYEFHILDNGVDKIVGFDVALGQAIADELGVEFEVKDISFDSILMELNAGTIDLGIAGFSPTPERMAAVDMSCLYYTGGQSLMIRKADADKYTGLSDFGAGKSVGAQTGSIQEGLAKEQTPEAALVSLQTVPSIIMELKSNKIDAAYIETVVAEGYVKTQDDLMILCEVPFDAEGSSVAVKKGNTEMLDFVNAVITKVVANGDMAKFVEEANELSTQAAG
ncbi:transporter substrate-binding domain-containing protein [Angelakisella massiliensis]|uniref:transporter substrate-binding domain-containing protein n=1 Tax=Angelakisella massiliensis TaxID=1871018 RepID=UPI0009F4B6D2|nr:transporter substrate-binding domain-containing protein [Angelakisella massiliensis]